MAGYTKYLKLSKARLSGLIATSTTLGFLSAGSPVHWGGLAAAVVGTSLASASASALNQIYEIPNDARMKRTLNRPLPSGAMTEKTARRFAVTCGLSGTALLAIGCNPLTAVLGAGNILLYSHIYTPMKQKTPWNTAVGAIVGAIPPVMGFTAATGALIAPEPLLLFMYQFMWQIPHFLALAYKYRHDYDMGGFRMLGGQLSDPSGKSCAMYSLLGSIAIMPLPFLTSYYDMTTWMFAVDSSAVNTWMLYHSINFYTYTTDENAMKLFKNSLISLALFLALFAYHKKNNNKYNLDMKNVHDVGAGMCIHERVVRQSPMEILCPATPKREKQFQVLHQE